MPDDVPDRFRWALDVMRIRPTDRVLEVGSGRGVAAALVAQRLDGGHVLGLDRSATMTTAALRLNEAHVAAGAVAFRTTSLADADLAPSSFDVAFAFNVSLFWTPPARELAVLARALVPGGRLFVLHQPPSPEKNPAVVEAATRLLTGAGWTVLETLVGDTTPVESVCVVARREP